MPTKSYVAFDVLEQFNRDPPPVAQAMERVYSAFEQYAIDWGWCPQCFGVEDKQRMRPHANIRVAPPEAFSAIYNEHPECSGGATTFLHWLPRGIELQFFSANIDPSLALQMFRLGMISWPDNDVEPLRQLFCRLALNWWKRADMAPLVLANAQGSQIDDAAIGQRLCEMLCALRVNMGSAATAMLEINTRAAWWSLLRVFRSQTFLEDSVYYVVHREEDEAIFRNARAALDRNARLGVSRSITREILVGKWEQVHAIDSDLADAISDAETFFDFYRFEQSEEDIVADLTTIELARQFRSRN